MIEVTLRFKTEDEQFVQDLRTSWLENEGVTIRVAGSGSRFVDLTYVKERGA